MFTKTNRRIVHTKTETICSIILKLLVVIGSCYGMVRGGLTLINLTYFTYLSNIAIDAILIVFVILDIRRLAGKEPACGRANGFYVVKFMFTISITLTFLAYMFLLAPLSGGGILGSYFRYGATSFFVHFWTPALAIIDFFVFDYDYDSTPKHTLYALIPPLCYVAFVVIAAYNGMRWWNMWAPYNFLNLGAPTGWFGFDLSLMSSQTLGIGVAYVIVGLAVIFILFGLLFLKIKDVRRRCQG